MKRLRILVPAVFLPFALLLAGCSDRRELNELYIVTGVAVDISDEPGLLDFCLQVAKTEQSGGGGSSESKSESKVILLRTRAATISQAIDRLSVESARELFLHHNQVILIGMELAEAGVLGHFDMFMRSMESRMQVPMMVVDGRADDVLAATPEQEPISGQFMAQMARSLGEVSRYYHVRVFDFSSRILSGSSAPLTAVVRLTKTDDQEEIKYLGMAVFDGGKIIGRLDAMEAQGYAWAMGGVHGGTLSVKTDAGAAVLSVDSLETQRSVQLDGEGGVRMSLSIQAVLGISEVTGFEGYTAQALIPLLNDVAAEAIRQSVERTFGAAREMRADIYELGVSVYRGHPKLWKDMEPRWPDIFSEAQLSVEVIVNIPGMGKTARSLEMGGEGNAN